MKYQVINLHQLNLIDYHHHLHLLFEQNQPKLRKLILMERINSI